MSGSLTTSQANGTSAGDTVTIQTAPVETAATSSSSGGLQPHWLIILIPFVIIIGLVIIGAAVYLFLRMRRKGLSDRSSRHSYPGAHERGQGRTGSTIDLPASAAPMGEGLNELGEAPPPYPPPEDHLPKENATIQVLQGAAGESSAESSSSDSSSSSSSSPNQTGGPSTTAPEMEETRNSFPPAYDAVMSQRVVSLLEPPTAVAGITVAAGRA